VPSSTKVTKKAEKPGTKKTEARPWKGAGKQPQDDVIISNSSRKKERGDTVPGKKKKRAPATGKKGAKPPPLTDCKKCKLPENTYEGACRGVEC
jgi:hypothetical protein